MNANDTDEQLEKQVKEYTKLVRLEHYMPEAEFLTFSRKTPIDQAVRVAVSQDLTTKGTRGFEAGIRKIRDEVVHELQVVRDNFEQRVNAGHENREAILLELRIINQDIQENADKSVVSREFGTVNMEITRHQEDARPFIDSIQASYNNAVAALMGLNERYGLNLPEEPQQTKNIPISLAWIVAAMILEIMINGFFFVDSSDSGIVGAIFKVFVFAPYNVLFAGLLGYFSFRYLCHYNPAVKAVAAISGLFLMALIFSLNIFVTALRVLSAPGREEYSIEEIIDGILSSRFLEFLDFESMGIMFLGFILAGFASWKSFHLKDRHPGFTEAYTKVQLLKDELNEAREDFLDTIRIYPPASEEKIDTVVNLYQKNRQTMPGSNNFWSRSSRYFELSARN